MGSAGLLSLIVSTAPISSALDPIKPDVGSPVGTHAADAGVLAPGFDPYGAADARRVERYEDLRRVARYIALIVAPVTAHEMGHAMGLMPDGLPPTGYFGDRGDVSFVGRQRTNSLHADLPGLNLMQAGGDHLGLLDELYGVAELIVRTAEILSLENHLSPLSRAYLQGRLAYEAADPGTGGYRIGCH